MAIFYKIRGPIRKGGSFVDWVSSTGTSVEKSPRIFANDSCMIGYLNCGVRETISIKFTDDNVHRSYTSYDDKKLSLTRGVHYFLIFFVYVKHSRLVTDNGR